MIGMINNLVSKVVGSVAPYMMEPKSVKKAVRSKKKTVKCKNKRCKSKRCRKKCR